MTQPSTTAPPSRWSVVASFALVGAATQLIWLNFAGVTTSSASFYGVSESAVGWLAQVFPLLYVVLAIPAGLLLDRWFRGGLVVGAVLTALGASLRLIGDDFVWVLIGQTVVAIAQPLVLNAMTGVAGRYLAPKDRPVGIAVGSASTFAGMILAFVLAALFPDAADLDVLIGSSAVFAIGAAACVIVALRKPADYQRSAPPLGLAPLRLAWRDGLVRRLCLLVFFPFGTFIALSTFAQALLEPAGVSSDAASVILLVNIVAGVIGCAIVPVVAAKRHREVAILAIASVATAVACLALAVAADLGVAFVAMVLIGLLLLPALPMVLQLVEQRTGEIDGTATGLIWMSGNLGGLIVATFVGLLVDRPFAAFVVCAVTALAALPILASLRPYLTR